MSFPARQVGSTKVPTPRQIFLALPSALALFVSMPASAAEGIEGRYEIEGRVGPDKSYKGQVLVERTGATYKVTWKTTGGNYIGTGILSGDAFAVTYVHESKAATSAGLALYRVQPGGILQGEYTTLGGKTIAPEIWRKGSGT